MRKIGIFLLLALIGLLNATEPNLIFNGDFRLGTAGFGAWRLLRPDTNPELQLPALRSEPGVLLLENPHGEYFQLIGKECLLPTGKKITFRSEFEGPAGGVLGFTLLCIKNNQYITHHKGVALSGKRQKVEISFFPVSGEIPYILVIYPKGKEAPAGTFRFYSFTLGGERQAPLLAALRTEKKLYIPEEENTCRIRAEIANTTATSKSGTLTLEILDSARNKVTARQALPLTLPPGNTVREFQVPLQKKGAFTATVRWNNQQIPVAEAMFACIGRYRGPATIHPAETFCVSVDGESTFERFRGETCGGYVVRGASFEERFRMLGLMGCRLIRDWGGMYLTEWVNLEPEEGRFDFRVFDRCVNLIRQNGMEILPVFGRMYENWAPGQPEFRPEWLKKKLIRIEKNPPGTDPKFVVKVPPMPIWRRYVEAIVKHAGKRISIYEIMNEPNLNMSPELYMQYMVPAAEIIRKEAPHATILGICATGDMNGRLGEYVQACTKLGALNYLDGVSFHPYDARQLSSITPADVQIAELRKITGNKPLYNTELYFLYDWPDVTDKFQQYRHVKAHHAACRFLIDLGEGLKQGISIVEKTLWQDPLHPSYRFMNYATDRIPSEVFVAYNALAQHFEGAKPVKKLRLSPDVIAYVYRKEGKLIAALWNYTAKPGITADLTPFQTMDLFGNPETAGVKEISESPFYLTPRTRSEAEFLSQLESLKLRICHPSTSPIARLVGDELHVTLHNAATEEQQVVLGVSGGGIRALRMVRAALPAKSSSSVTLPVRKVSPGRQPAELMLYTNGTTFRLPVKIVSAGAIKRTFLLENADGTIDLQKDKILITMNVRDTSDSGPTAGRPLWKTDCVELFFDPAPFLLPEQHPDAHINKPGAFRLFVTPRDAQKLSGMGAVKPSNCRLTVNRNDSSGYSFRLEIPVNSSPALGFCVKLNDAQGGKIRETVLKGVPRPVHLNCCSFPVVTADGNETTGSSK